LEPPSQDNTGGPIDDSGDDTIREAEGSKKQLRGKWLKLPTKRQIQDAIMDLKKLLQPL